MNRFVLPALLAMGLSACGAAAGPSENEAMNVIQTYQAGYPKENRVCQIGLTTIGKPQGEYSESLKTVLTTAQLMRDAGLLVIDAPKDTILGKYYPIKVTPAFERDFQYADQSLRGEVCTVNYKVQKVNKVEADGDIATVTAISQDDGTTPWNKNTALLNRLKVLAPKPEVIQTFTLTKQGDAWHVQSVQMQ
ncbi:hypothetical protein [Deinococcus sp. Marseille-Q6407]|uniref:hypothetical protein n=1 Tax=Deinococcus sp. Marseille-Q6407 TaxID=2969223 RepID=UPI0021BE0633|nr:hypothetical protein [Deinococcus sp. Marseille-Q6407]